MVFEIGMINITTLMHIIGFTGKAGSGKDTCADMITRSSQFDFDVCTAFAKPIKDAARELFMLTRDQLHGSLKEVVDERWGASPRQIMQWLGTDMLRKHFGDDFFLKHMKMRIEHAKNANVAMFLITDVRFDNEAEMVRDMGGKVVRIARPGVKPVNAHVSENGIQNRLVDFTIQNDSNLDALRDKLFRVCRKVVKTKKLACAESLRKRRRTMS